MLTVTTKDKHFLVYTSILGFLYLLPIILADFYFVDDIRRSIEHSAWGKDGRLLANVVFAIFNSSTIVLDFSPLTQILGMSCLVMSSFLIYKIFFSK